MKRSILRLTMNTFTTWLTQRLPPSGQPYVHDLQARWTVLVEALVDQTELPDMGDINKLDADHMSTALEWLFSALNKAHVSDSWTGIAVHSLRLLALRNVSELLTMIASPPKTIDPVTPRTHQ